MTLRACALALVALLCAGLAQAQAPETLGWLRKIHDATQKLSYSGTFVYQNGSRSETSRITRYVDAGGDIEKLEVMDGVPREIVRSSDTVRCYLPDARVVKIESRATRARLSRRCCRSGSRRSRATTTSARRDAGASPATTAGRWCSRPRTTCATATALRRRGERHAARAVTVDANGEHGRAVHASPSSPSAA